MEQAFPIMSTMEKSSDDHESLFATDGPTWTWHHIFGLTMPSFSGSVNVYETGSRSRPPLPLDKLLEGHPPVAAESPLFARLPIEVLTHVLSFLPADALLSFAMVNSDCRQIARSVWFETVVFDYDFDSAFGLSEVLGKELSPPRLGACVRRLVVATNRGYFQWLHGIEMQSLQDLSEQEKERKLQTAADIYFGYYIPY